MNGLRGLIPFVIAAACLAASSVQAEQLQPSPLPPSGKRQAVFISDVHLGLGHQQQDSKGEWTKGPWHAMEDFRWKGEFAQFLTYLRNGANNGNVPVDLVIVGDFMELWQSAQDDCRYPGQEGADGRDFGCTAADALSRARRVIGAHGAELEALRDFANDGDNRLTIVPGNHDAALVFDAVAKAVLVAIGGRADRVRIAREGYWRSRDGLVLAEHGHLFEGEVNRYDKLPASCLDGRARPIDCNAAGQQIYLRRPWGEQFVQSYYNAFEERYPIIDNISEEGQGVKLGMAAANVGEVATAIKDFFRFFLFGQSVSQLLEALGPQEAGSGHVPRYDFAAIRAQGDRFLVESIPNDDPLRKHAEAALARNALGLKVSDLKNEELGEICSLRQARIRVAKKQNASPQVTACPLQAEDAALGAVVTTLLVERETRFRNRLNEVRDGLADDARPTRDFALYIYGHTHKAHGSQQFFDQNAEWNPLVLNTGAWQRVATPDQLKVIQRAKKIKDEEALLRLQPEDLPPCYTYISVMPYDADRGERPYPELLYWVWDDSKKVWHKTIACPP